MRAATILAEIRPRQTAASVGNRGGMPGLRDHVHDALPGWRRRAIGADRPSPLVWAGGSHPPAQIPPITAGLHLQGPRTPAQGSSIEGGIRQTMADPAIHKPIPGKAHLSRFDPPNRPPTPTRLLPRSVRCRRQTACKPGSVPSAESPLRMAMAIPLGRALPCASCDRPERRREGPPGMPSFRRHACRSYLVLLPVGFSLPPPLPATRCALTAPFHPCRPPDMQGGLGGVLSVALSLGSPPPGVTRHRASMEPGLSSPRTRRRAAIRPSDRERSGRLRGRCQSLF